MIPQLHLRSPEAWAIKATNEWVRRDAAVHSVRRTVQAMLHAEKFYQVLSAEQVESLEASLVAFDEAAVYLKGAREFIWENRFEVRP